MSCNVETQCDVAKQIQLVHHQQRYNWDCGISCCLMVLPHDKREYLITHLQSICKEEGFNKSTWTIDLCYLLKKFSVDFKFYTTQLGIDPQHKKHNFYEKIIKKDEQRVIQRFNEAAENDIHVEEKSLSVTELVSHVRDYGPVIVLTNADYLLCKICRRHKLAADLMNCLPWAASYHGHYIVLCGYDLSTNTFYYRNPTYSNRICLMDFSTLDRARQSSGTDEDCICVCFNTNNSYSI